MDVLNLNLNSFEKMCKKKCAEVFYQNIEDFSIVCTQCDLEAFKFEDFLAHFKEVHCCEEKFDPNIIKRENIIDDGSLLQQACNSSSILYEDPIEITCTADTFRDLEGNVKSEDESLDSHDRLEINTDSEDDNVPLKLLGGRFLRRNSNKTRQQQSKESKTEHICIDCGKTYKSRKALTRHIRMKHRTSPINPEIFHCNSCDKTYVTKSALQAHVRMKHRKRKDGSKPGTYPCTECDKIYTDKYSLKEHLIRHLGQRNFSCDAPGCLKKFFSRKNLNFHVKNMHIGIKNYVCEICGHSTKHAASLAVHKRIHTGEKPFNCSTCGKAFATQSGVREHQVTHNAIDERPHVCKICGKTFARPKALYHHMPLHLGIKKFVCQICGKAYSQQAGLSAHKRQHLLNNFGEET